MEGEVDLDIIKNTQITLGKYVKRPQLSEKLLKKPPFRFLHDIVTTIIKTTGFFEGLFDDEELISDNVKDRDSKITFLNKVITVVATTTGRSLTVKSSKIVAGQEAEKTNELLQSIAFALDSKLSSDNAVKIYKSSSNLPTENKTERPKDSAKSVKKINDVKKLTSRSNEKLTTTKRDSARSLTRNEKEKVNVKTKTKESSTKKETASKKTTQPLKTLTKTNSVEKSASQNDKKVKSKKSTDSTSNEVPPKIYPINDNVDPDSGASIENNDVIDTNEQKFQTLGQEGKADGKLNSLSYTIDNLNSSLSSQDLMEVDHNAELNPRINNYEQGTENNEHNVAEKEPPNNENTFFPTDNKKKSNEKDRLLSPAEGRRRNSSQYENIARDNTEYENKSGDMDNYTQTSQLENPQNNSRPKTLRPSSSRPGAPRLRDKHETVVTGNENLIVGKVNIIIENTSIEEEEDSSIIIVDHEANTVSISQDGMQLSSDQQHGALVQQILDSQKEFSQAAGKTEIEWQFGAQKAREAINQEIEQLRFNIQALSRAANPLGKVLDHIQEDVEVMRQELQQWTKTYEEASKELQKQKIANEDSLIPLHTKLKQLDSDILEKNDKINDLKIILHKNSSRIEKLLAGGDVQ